MKYYKEIKLENWDAFKKLAEKSDLSWIFRGQSNADWHLLSSLDRANFDYDISEYEEGAIEEFKQGAKFYLKEEQTPVTLLEWFSLFQHFGAPSRLLDFTKSPYIAAYFAFEQAFEDYENVAIWVVNKFMLWQVTNFYFENKIDKSNSFYHVFDDETFESVFNLSKEIDFDCIFTVEPKNVNQRYHIQQSIFLCQGNPEKHFNDQLDFIGKSQIGKAIMKVTIPSSEKGKAIRDLIKMNITRATLFPGLDGFAKSLFLKYITIASTWHDLGENNEFMRGLNMK